MNDAGFGNAIKQFEIHQRRYLGSKRKLIEFIGSILNKEKVKFDSFADLFAGTGIVAYSFFHKSNIIVNDILEANYQAYIAFFGKEKIRMGVLEEKLQKYNHLNSAALEENYFSINFSNTYFDHANSLKIGNIREDIEHSYLTGALNTRERAYLITTLIYALDKIANTVGHYDAYRKINIPEKELTLLPLKILNSNRSSFIYKQDANQLATSIYADVVYIDPPYNSRQYSDAYHLLENIAEWKKDSVYGIAKKIDRLHIKSKYSLKSATDSFNNLIEHLDTKYILVSYNDMGSDGDIRSQSRITDQEILSALQRRGNVKVYEKSFKQFTTGKSNKANLKERIFFCKVGANKRIVNMPTMHNKKVLSNTFVKSPLNYTGGKHKLLPQLLKIFPNDVETFYDVFCGGGNVGINAKASKVVCIDNSKHVIALLNLIKDVSFEILHREVLAIIEKYGLSQSYINGYTSYDAESSKGLGSFNKSQYLQLREDYNQMAPSQKKTTLLLVLVMYSFNNQIRFNFANKFNLPVGKRDYNGNSRRNLLTFGDFARDAQVNFVVNDFRNLLKYSLKPNDFVYLDPPYLLGTATYNESNAWNEKDEHDLYQILDELTQRKIRFALSNIIDHKGKHNDILEKWAIKSSYKLHIMDFHYNNSNYQSKAKLNRTVEVLVTNY